MMLMKKNCGDGCGTKVMVIIRRMMMMIMLGNERRARRFEKR